MKAPPCGIHHIDAKNVAADAHRVAGKPHTLPHMNIGDYIFPVAMGLLASLSLLSAALRIGRDINKDSVEIDIAACVGFVTAVVAVIADSPIESC